MISYSSIYKFSFLTLSLFPAIQLYSTDRYFKTGDGLFNTPTNWYLDDARTIVSTVVPQATDTIYLNNSNGNVWLGAYEPNNRTVDGIVATGANNRFTLGDEAYALDSYSFTVTNKVKVKISDTESKLVFGTATKATSGALNLNLTFGGIEIGKETYSTYETYSGVINAYFSYNFSHIANSKITVNGDFDIGGSKTGGNTGITTYLGADSIVVNGKLNFARNGSGYSNIYFQKSTVMELNGISATSVNGDFTIAASGNQSTIVLKNAAKTDTMYIGLITDNPYSTTDSSAMNITMSGEGTQRIFSAIKTNATISGKRQSGTYTAQNGKLFFENTRVDAANRVGKLVLYGGEFGAAHYDTANSGTAYFKNAEFKSGGLAFENFVKHNSLETNVVDKIVITEGITKTGSDKIAVDFSDADGNLIDLSESSDLNLWVEILTAVSLTGFDLTQSIAENVYDANGDFYGIGLSKSHAIFKWIAKTDGVGSITGYGLNVSFTQVPEPSSIAAMLGVFAFALAVVYRRSK